MKQELLTPEQMGQADRLAIKGGTPGNVLMERAGVAVCDAVLARTTPETPILVLCGPGNNGGDGFVAARLLRTQGRKVEVLCLADPAGLHGDASWAFESLNGPWKMLSGEALENALRLSPVIIDALFGAGLDRPLSGFTAEVVERINEAQLCVVSVDLPSGLNGATGGIAAGPDAHGCALKAEASVTFFRKKPGHLLFPGRGLCGEVILADIGIPESVLAELDVRVLENGPGLWCSGWQAPGQEGHKYSRGHALVFSGGATTSGAARLSATAALRAGAGLVTLASPPSAVMVNACHLTAVMLKSVADPQAAADLLQDKRLNALAIGPGFGVGGDAVDGKGARTRDFVSCLLYAGRALVLDADALTSFAASPELLFEGIRKGAAAVVMTPHEGEFARLFPDLKEGSRLERAGLAAERSGAVVVLKGADTVIAAPDGRAAINCNGSPWLATAGSGDVLTGIICGLLAQSMPLYEAACMGVWLHGAAGTSFGPGLIAEDLPDELPKVFKALLEEMAGA